MPAGALNLNKIATITLLESGGGGPSEGAKRGKIKRKGP